MLHSELIANPFPDWLGIEVEEWRVDFVQMTLALAPHHLNRSGAVHGALISALLEYGVGLCGLYCTVSRKGRYGMTLSLTCNFIGVARGGGELKVIGRRRGGGRNFYQTAAADAVATDALVVRRGPPRTQTFVNHCAIWDFQPNLLRSAAPTSS